MDTYYELKDNTPVIPHKATRIDERNSSGLLVGAYNGYYDPRKGTYTLYPRYSPHVVQLKPIIKHVVSDRLVRRKV